jgi:L-threonylcarbamoyladenylate synthase
VTFILPAGEAGALQQALDVLAGGGLVAFPTDTVYGLGARLLEEGPNAGRAIDRLYQAKGRAYNKAIAVLIGRFSDLDLVANKLNPSASRLAERFWPGALTLVVNRRPELPANLAQGATIGVRMPAHPLALELLKRSGPLAVTSANLSDHPDCVTADQVFAQLNGRIALILDGGAAPGGQPSTVVDCTGQEPGILRLGPISLEEIHAAL